MFSVTFEKTWKETKNIIQLSPKGEVDSGVVCGDAKRRGIYLSLFTDAEGESCLSIYQISGIKMKKGNFSVN